MLLLAKLEVAYGPFMFDFDHSQGYVDWIAREMVKDRVNINKTQPFIPDMNLLSMPLYAQSCGQCG